MIVKIKSGWKVVSHKKKKNIYLQISKNTKIKGITTSKLFKEKK